MWITAVSYTHLVWTHEKDGTGKIGKDSYGMDRTRKKEKRKTTCHSDRRNLDYTEGTTNRRSLDGQAVVEDENSTNSVIFGSGKCVNIVQPE